MHPHDSPFTEKRLIISILLTGLIFLAELIGGLWSGSLALLSDSAHVFLDVFALGLSYLGLRLSSMPPDDRHTFGYHRLEVLAALVNGVTLVLIAGGILWEAAVRWMHPLAIRSEPMLVIAVIGLLANLFVALILRPEHQHAAGQPHRHEDLNMRGAFLHVVGDAVSSVGVILAAVLIAATGKSWIDPLTSALIGLLILWGAGRLTRQAVHILIEGTPEGMNAADIRNVLAQTPGVEEVHDLHVWSLCSGTISLSAHVTIDETIPNNRMVLLELQRRLRERFGIEHTTLQLETQDQRRQDLITIS